jgi:hypothetical protein
LLRDALGEHRGIIELHEGELTHLHAAELAIHPAVTRAVKWPASAPTK